MDTDPIGFLRIEKETTLLHRPMEVNTKFTHICVHPKLTFALSAVVLPTFYHLH